MSDNRSSWLPCSAFPSRAHMARDGFGSARDTDTFFTFFTIQYSPVTVFLESFCSRNSSLEA